MDAALSLVSLVGKRLIACKRAYDSLVEECDDLLATLAAMEHLLKERAKERRLDGAVQQQFVKALGDLRDELIDIMDNLEERKASMWCGSMIGKGAAKASRRLKRQSTLLKDLLSIAHAESSNVTASAVEEMAGGAAGKLIPHEGMRSFWREQFKNDFQLTWPQFLSGLMKFESELDRTFHDALPRMLRALRLTLDPSRDGLVSVNEFSQFLSGHSLPPGADMVEVLRHQLTVSRTLLPALAVGHQQAITACATNDHTFCTADSKGFVQFYAVMRDHIANTGFAFLNGPATALCFAEYNERLHLLAGMAGHTLVIDCATYEIVSTIESFAIGAQYISSDQEFVLMSSFSPEGRVSVHRRIDTGISSSAQASGAEGGVVGRTAYFECHGHLVHSATPREVAAAGDGRHLLTWTSDSGVMLWDYRRLVMVHRLPGTAFCTGYCVRPHPSAKTCAVDVFLTNSELHFPNVLDTRNAVEHRAITSPSLTRVSSTKFCDSQEFVTVSYERKEHAVILGWSGDATAAGDGLETDHIELPKSFKVLLIRCFRKNRFANAVVCGSIGERPTTMIVKPPSENLEEAKRGNEIVWPTARLVGGMQFWTCHMRHKRKVPWTSSQMAACVLGGPGQGGSLIATSLIDRKIHLFDLEGNLVHAQELAIAGRFLDHIQSMVFVPPHDVVIFSVDGIVLRYNFGPPYDVVQDCGASSAATAIEELNQLIGFAETRLVPQFAKDLIASVEHMSMVARVPVLKRVALLQLEHKAALGTDDCEAILAAFVEAKTEVQHRLADEQAQPSWRPPPFLADLHAAEAQRAQSTTPEPVLDNDNDEQAAGLLRVSAPDGDGSDGDAAAGKDAPAQHVPAPRAPSPDMSGPVSDSTAMHWSRFTNPRRWASPAARCWMINGRTYCSDCGKGLRRREANTQVCKRCQMRRYDLPTGTDEEVADHIYTVCDHCDAAIKNTVVPLCHSCEESTLRRMRMVPVATTAFGDFLLITCSATDRLALYGPGGHLFKMKRDTLDVVDSIQDIHAISFDALTSSSELGGFAAAPIGYDQVALFAAKPGDLRDSIVGHMEVGQLVQSIAVAGEGDNLIMAVSTLKPEVIVASVRASTDPAADPAHPFLTITKQRSIYPPVPSYKAVISPRFLFVCLRTGAVRVYSLDLGNNALVGELQGHGTARIVRAFLIDDKFVSLTADGIASVTPRSLIHQMADNHANTVANTTDGTRRSASMSLLLRGSRCLLICRGHEAKPVRYIDHSWFSRTSATASWQTMDAGRRYENCERLILNSFEHVREELEVVNGYPAYRWGDRSCVIHRCRKVEATRPAASEQAEASDRMAMNMYGAESTKRVNAGESIKYFFSNANIAAHHQIWLCFRTVLLSPGVKDFTVSSKDCGSASVPWHAGHCWAQLFFDTASDDEEIEDAEMTVTVNGEPGSFAVLCVPPRLKEEQLPDHTAALYVATQARDSAR